MTLKHAKYCKDVPSGSSPNDIKQLAGTLVTPETMTVDMSNHIYCPECGFPVFRSPRLGNQQAIRQPFFSHKPDVQHECELKSKSIPIRRYNDKNEVLKDIETGSLVIIHEFSDDEIDEKSKNSSQHFVQSGNSNSRNLKLVGKGKNKEVNSFPSSMTSLKTICRHFDENLTKWFVLPEEHAPKKLVHLLVNVESIEAIDLEKSICYGRITKVERSGTRDDNVVNFHLAYERRVANKQTIADFTLRTTNIQAYRMGLNDSCVGHYLLMYGSIQERGIGLCIWDAKKSEVALLPQKYDYLLDTL